MKTNFIKRCIVALFFCSSMIVFGQPGSGSDNGGVDDNGSTDSTPGAPIDCGITLLIAAGALYGAKKVNDKRN